MDIYVLDNDYAQQEIVDAYQSAIWTERYKGDGDFELNLPVTSSQLSLLPTGTLLECEGSEQPMIVEEIDTEDDMAKLTGITVTEWFNNRFIRSSPDPTVKVWTIDNVQITQLISDIAQNWLVDSTYLSSGGMGFDANYLKIPGLFVGSHPTAGPTGTPIPYFSGDIEFGPVYDTIRQLADQVGVGLKTYLHDLGGGERNLGFQTYVGKRKSTLSSPDYKLVRLSPDLDNFINVKELQSESDHWNEVYLWFPELDQAAMSAALFYDFPGYVWTNWTYVYQNAQPHTIKTPWDRRVRQDFSELTQAEWDDLPVWDGVTPPIEPDNALEVEAKQKLIEHKFVHLIDGEVISSDDLVYGQDYGLGDIVGMQGYGDAVLAGQVTEFIRSKDQEGEKAYPTVERYNG